MWYQAIALDQLESTFTETGNTVINKLRVRFPDKFNVKDAHERDLDSERTVLEQSEGSDHV